MTSIRISIQKPCEENWAGFQGTQTARHCPRCSKVVVDFSSLSDAQVLESLSGQQGVCGRMRPDQLKVYADPSRHGIRPGFGLLKAGLLSLLLLLINRPANAIDPPMRFPDYLELVSQLEGSEPTKAKLLVRGVVRAAEDGLPLPGVNVLLKGSNIGTVTDMNGNFEFPERLEEGDVLIIAFIGFETTEYTIKRPAFQDKNSNVLELNIDIAVEVMWMGELAIEPMSMPQSRVSRLWSAIKSIF